MVSFYTIKANMTIGKNMVENKKKITVKNRLKFLKLLRKFKYYN